MSETDGPIPELPYARDFIDAAKGDLDAARALLQRLLAITDALFATAITLTSLFAGLAFTNKNGAIAFVAIPLLVVLAYLDGLHWAHFRRAAARVRSLERLFHAYVAVLREAKTVRPQVIQELRVHIKRYQFGVERALEPVSLRLVWLSNWRRVRWWMYPVVALVLVVFGVWFVPDKESTSGSVCITDAAGTVVKFERTPSVVTGSITLVPCPTPPAVPPLP